jgi:plastocyanin
MRNHVTVTLLSFAVLVLAACGGSDGPSEPSGPPPVQTTTITITSAGVSPKNVEVGLGTRVRFVNNDNRPHNMASDPHPIHTDCPVINQVGLLLPGQMRETGNLVEVRTCGFHDHDNATNQNLNGTITTR